MGRDTYENFQLTAENCGQEPIHKHLATQGYGFLLAFEATPSGSLYYTSENVADLLKMPIRDMWHAAPEKWLPPSLLECLREMDRPPPWTSTDPVPIKIAGKELQLLRHIQGNVKILELEPRTTSHIGGVENMLSLTSPLDQFGTLPDLFSFFTQSLKEITGYDRVMVYRFDEDHHGVVEGEAMEDDMESFFGLHFPESDIPKVARDLFLKNHTRIIPKVSQDPSWLVFRPDIASADKVLDLSRSQLRGTSPIHLKYLENMGVGASITLALVLDRQLWGLITAHHRTPKYLDFQDRKFLGMMAQALTQRISEIIRDDRHREEHRNKDSELVLRDVLKPGWNTILQLVEESDKVSHLVEADGYALITESLGLYQDGISPHQDTLLELSDWLDQQPEFKNLEFYCTRNIQRLSGIQGLAPIGGLMAIELHDLEAKVLWFKKAEREIVTWGGDPSKTLIIEKKEDGSTALGPRSSFQKWETAIEEKSTSWSLAAQNMAFRIKELIAEHQGSWDPFRHRPFEEELDQFTHVTSHDLQEPLLSITGYLKMVSDSLNSELHKDLMHFIERAQMATDRMRGLVHTMLNYSLASMSSATSWFPLEELLTELELELQPVISDAQGTIVYEDLPEMKADYHTIKQLFKHLIDNSLQYRQPEVPAQIEIKVKHAGTHFLFSVADNGVGIDEKYYSKIFLLFQTLQAPTKRKGLGIGLALCRKIIERMNGRIWVTSSPGKGTTIWFTLHQSNFRMTDDENTQISIAR